MRNYQQLPGCEVRVCVFLTHDAEVLSLVLDRDEPPSSQTECQRKQQCGVGDTGEGRGGEGRKALVAYETITCRSYIQCLATLNEHS